MEWRRVPDPPAPRVQPLPRGFVAWHVAAAWLLLVVLVGAVVLVFLVGPSWQVALPLFGVAVAVPVVLFVARLRTRRSVPVRHRDLRRIGWRMTVWAGLALALIVGFLVSPLFMGGGESPVYVVYEATLVPANAGVPYDVLLPAPDWPPGVDLVAGDARVERVASTHGGAIRVQGVGPVALRAEGETTGPPFPDGVRLSLQASGSFGAGGERAYHMHLASMTTVQVALSMEVEAACGFQEQRLDAVARSGWRTYPGEVLDESRAGCGVPWGQILGMLVLSLLLPALVPLFLAGVLGLSVVEAFLRVRDAIAARRR